MKGMVEDRKAAHSSSCAWESPCLALPQPTTQWGGKAESRRPTCFLNANMSCLKVFVQRRRSLRSRSRAVLAGAAPGEAQGLSIPLQPQKDRPERRGERLVRTRGLEAAGGGGWEYSSRYFFPPSPLQPGCASTNPLS